MIQRVLIRKDIREAAEAAGSLMGAVHNSILGGRGNAAGIAAELALAELIGARRQNTKDYDLILPDGITVDVKCKRTQYQPEWDYEASVAATSAHQECHIYAFARVLYNMSWLYVCGFYPKDLYFRDASYLKKGDYDPSNDFTVKWSCHNLPHERLMSWEEAVAHVRKTHGS